jgi:hypothetical protein
MMDWFVSPSAAADEALRRTDQELLASLTGPPSGVHDPPDLPRAGEDN